MFSRNISENHTTLPQILLPYSAKFWRRRIESHSPIFCPAKITYIVLNCSSTWINFCACASDESAKIDKDVHRPVKDLQDPWGILAS